MSLAFSIPLGIIFTVLILMSLSGNALVCAAIFLDRRLRHQHENLFLISLAVSDLLVSVLVMLPAAVNDILSQWLFGTVYCSLWFSFDIACCTASILNLCAIAFDRYVHISAPMLYTRAVTKTKIIYLIVLVWFASLAIGFLPRFFTNFSSSDIDPLSLLSVHNASSVSNVSVHMECTMELKPVFAIISSCISFFIPASVMVIAYGKLYLYARQHVKAMQQQRSHIAAEMLMAQWTATLMAPADRKRPATDPQQISRRLSSAQEASQHISRRRITTQTKHKKAMKEHKARITLGVIIGVFLFCWLPFFIVNVIRSLLPDVIPTWAFLAVTWLGYANSTANPVIYTVLNRDFRSAFHKIILHVFPKKHPSRRRYYPPKSDALLQSVKFKTFAAADNYKEHSSAADDYSRSCLAANNSQLNHSGSCSYSDYGDMQTKIQKYSKCQQHHSRMSMSLQQIEETNQHKFYRNPRHHTLSIPSLHLHGDGGGGASPGSRCSRTSLPVGGNQNMARRPADERTALVEKHVCPYEFAREEVPQGRKRSASTPPEMRSIAVDLAGLTDTVGKNTAAESSRKNCNSATVADKRRRAPKVTRASSLAAATKRSFSLRHQQSVAK